MLTYIIVFGLKDDEGGYELSNKKSMVIHLPIRVQQQLIAKKRFYS